jgi:hypothetical protein
MEHVDGAAVEVSADMHFQVTAISHGSHRPKTIPFNVPDAESIAIATATLAVTLQHLDLWATRSATKLTCFFERGCCCHERVGYRPLVAVATVLA